ncbi:MAG: exported protein of unknown function [Bryobacterales bacterium]|nr:exported protein of unknown function [Bryobacterales bacterium]
MTVGRLSSATTGILLVCAAGTLQAQSGIDPDRLANIQAQLAQVKDVLSRIPDSQRGAMSGGAQNLLQLANTFEEAVRGLSEAPAVGPYPAEAPPADASIVSIRSRAAAARAVSALPDPTRVSNPLADSLFSVVGGFTQSETSTSWCGNSVVVGFNDSGSISETTLFGSGGLSLSGSAFSTNGGLSFRDIGFVNPGPNPVNLLAGDPTVSCSDRNTFYYTQIFRTGTVSPLELIAAVGLSKSTDSGASWEDPIAAVSKPGATHFLDKPWSAVDPANPNRLFVTYTDFDQSGSVCGFASPNTPNPRVAIELVRSLDGGATWSAPLVLDESCNVRPAFPLVQGSQVAVDPHGTVFVAWEAYPSGTAASFRELRVARSFDQAASFDRYVRAAVVAPAGSGVGVGSLQGGIRNNEFPSLAIDRSPGASNGYLYLTWNDGRNLRVRDLQSGNGTYGYSDILLSRSIDGGRTWSPPVRVNDNPTALPNGRGTDQFQPGVAVDKTGAVGVCWYDRRADPVNFLIRRSCGVSKDGGTTWTNLLAATPAWAPFHGADLLINPLYLGDYDVLASDVMGASSGFMGAYASVTTSGVVVPNQDVLLIHLP